jgi:LacI family gluconate utilization system Gnt-I transcriptional repressor
VRVSDHPAFGALMPSAGAAAGRCRGSVAIAGFGGFEVGSACHPHITTVAMDCFGIGRTAGELLIRAIDAARAGQRLAPETVVIPYRIELRGST